MNFFDRVKSWLLPTTLILSLMSFILLPIAMQITYAGRNETPNHVLTYTTNKLTWDSATEIDPISGVAELSLFSNSYQNVIGENEDKVVAPGTNGKNIVRLKNNSNNTITYIAIMYKEKNESTLPIEPVLMDNTSFANTETYPLPAGVSKEQVVRAVTGSLAVGQIQDFDITWHWEYFENNHRDSLDTNLGNKASWSKADNITAGLYIVVEEEEFIPSIIPDAEDYNFPNEYKYSYIYPSVPQTGDSSNIVFYLMLMIISGILLTFFLFERRKVRQ